MTSIDTRAAVTVGDGDRLAPVQRATTRPNGAGACRSPCCSGSACCTSCSRCGGCSSPRRRTTPRSSRRSASGSAATSRSWENLQTLFTVRDGIFLALAREHVRVLDQRRRSVRRCSPPWRATRSRSTSSPVKKALFSADPRRDHDPAHGAGAADVPAVLVRRTHGHAVGDHHPVARQSVRRLPHAGLRRRRRSPTASSRRRASTAPASSGSSGRSACACSVPASSRCSCSRSSRTWNNYFLPADHAEQLGPVSASPSDSRRSRRRRARAAARRRCSRR